MRNMSIGVKTRSYDSIKAGKSSSGSVPNLKEGYGEAYNLGDGHKYRAITHDAYGSTERGATSSVDRVMSGTCDCESEMKKHSCPCEEH